MSQLPPLTLVIGGASSGKSDFAEQLVIGDGRPKTYIATGQAFDAEMAEKIACHKATRSGAGWKTIEEPVHLAKALKAAAENDVVLIDCATLWLTNLMLTDVDVQVELNALVDAVASNNRPVVIVSNEVGQGIVPENQLARKFRAAQGSLNRRFASEASLVVQVTVGLPLVLKGALPKDAM